MAKKQICNYSHMTRKPKRILQKITRNKFSRMAGKKGEMHSVYKQESVKNL